MSDQKRPAAPAAPQGSKPAPDLTRPTRPSASQATMVAASGARPLPTNADTLPTIANRQAPRPPGATMPARPAPQSPLGSGAPRAPRPPGQTNAELETAIRSATSPSLPSARTPVAELAQVQDYRILRPLGRGGLAQVSLGERPDGRQAAIKLLLPQFAQDPEIVRRFMLEMKAGASLRHENVIEILEFGEWRGNYFLAAEYMDGGSLRDLTVRAVGRLAPPVAEAVTIMLLRGLATAHAQKVIHRDVKPANIMLRTDGTAKLGDFGIARALDLPGLTRTGLLMGTPAYMSPEQAQGFDLDHRSDLFAVGIVLFELLTGFNPFAGVNESASMLRIIQTEPPLLFEVNPALPASLDAILGKLFAKDRDLRYPNAEAVLADLAAASPGVALHPKKVVREALADPGRSMARWALGEARTHFARAKSLLDEGPARRPLAILELFRAHALAPDATDAAGQLRALYGTRDPFAPSTNPKVAALEAELALLPTNHALLMQLAALHRLEHNLVGAVACFKRAVRLRPEDGYATGQLRTLVGEEADISLAAGHLTLATMPPRPPQQLLVSGSFASAPGRKSPLPSPRRESPLPISERPFDGPDAARSLGSRAPGLVALALLVLLVGWGVRGIGRFISRAQDESVKSGEQLAQHLSRASSPEQQADDVARRTAALRAEAELAFNEAARQADANHPQAQASLEKFRRENPKSLHRADATWLLAQLAVREGRLEAAVEELRAFLADVPSDPRVPQARAFLAGVLETKGDSDAALLEFEGIVRDHPSSPLVNDSLVRQAVLLETKGDVATAKVRYEAVRDRTGPRDAAWQLANQALERLGVASAAE